MNFNILLFFYWVRNTCLQNFGYSSFFLLFSVFDRIFVQHEVKKFDVFKLMHVVQFYLCSRYKMYFSSLFFVMNYKTNIEMIIKLYKENCRIKL